MGSRATSEEERMKGHLKCPHTRRSASVFVIENGTYTVNTIEPYPCDCDADVCTSNACKKRLCRREGEHIRQYKNQYGALCVNKEIAGRTLEEYKVDNHTHIRSKDADYRDTNREEVRRRSLQWYHDNKQAVSKKTSVPTACELCGKVVRKDSMDRHMGPCFKNSCDGLNLIEI